MYIMESKEKKKTNHTRERDTEEKTLEKSDEQTGKKKMYLHKVVWNSKSRR